MAVATYDRALEYSTSYFPAQIGKGIVLSRANRHQEAIEEFERILDNTQLTEARQAQTWFYLGKTLCKSRLNPEGIAAFEQAIRLNPNYEAAEQAKKRCIKLNYRKYFKALSIIAKQCIKSNKYNHH